VTGEEKVNTWTHTGEEKINTWTQRGAKPGLELDTLGSDTMSSFMH
jgi:hypothetical protein